MPCPGYCRSCYCELPEGAALCATCAAEQPSPLQKVIIVVGLAAIPVLFTGIGMLNAKLCVAGVAIAAAAAVIYAVLSLRA